MFSGVTSSARSPSQTKMMTLRAGGPPCCGAAGPPASPSTTNDKAKMNLLIFMVVLVSEFACGRSPRRSRKGKDCEQLVAAFAKARHHAWAALGPRALEGREGGTGRVGAGSVDDTMEVVADRGQCVLRRFPLEVAELVYTAALHHRP